MSKLKILRIALFTIFACTIFVSQAQPKVRDSSLIQKLKGQIRLENIMTIVQNHYKETGIEIQNKTDEEEEFEGNPMTQWARWAYQNSSRLDEKGNLTDFASRNFEAFLKEQSRVAINPDPGLLSNTGLWSQLGPFNTSYGSNAQNYRGLGRVDRIAFHPTNPNTIFVGTPAGGLWRTTDNGSNWSLLTKYLPSPGISGIVVSWSNANTIYILTGDGDSDGGGFVESMGYIRRSAGVFRSTDGGSTWYQMGAFPSSSSNLTGFKLIQDPSNANTLLAATSEGIYKTENGGSTWTRTRTGTFFDIVYRTGSSTIVFATGSGSDRFIRSTTGGDTWSTSIGWNPGTPSSTGRGQIAVGTSNTSVVYILWGPVPNAGGSYKGLYRSADAGLNFTLKGTTPNILGGADDGSDNRDQSGYDLGIAVKPTNSNNIATAGLTVWTSSNAGDVMTHRTSFNEGGALEYIHPDIHDIKYHPTSGWLYATSDGGVFRSNDDGVTWTDISSGVATTQFYKGAGFEGNVNLFLGGAQDNGVLYRPSNTSTFRFVLCCDGFEGAFYPNDATKAYTSMNTSVFRQNLNGGGSDISPWINGKWFITLATHPTDGNTVYVGSDSLCRSDDQGNNWPTRTASDGAWALSSCKSNVNRVYAAGGNVPWASSGNIRRSDNQGGSWTNINGTGFGPTNLKITSIGVRPTNSVFVWATLGGFSDGNKVFRTSNGDNASPTWTNVSGNLPNVPVNCIAVDANNNAYIGTDIGVYYRGSGMSDWVPFYNYLPRTPVSSLILNETEGVIKAVTFGHGVWQSEVYSTCPASQSITGTVTGYKFFESGTLITSTADVFGGDNTEVFYKSGNRIDLTPGFLARSGNAVFKAFIGPCGNGLPTLDSAGSVKPPRIPRELTTSYPDGSIMSTPMPDGASTLQVMVPMEGNYTILAADENGKTVEGFSVAATLSSGKNSINLPSKPAGAFYLRLMRDGKLCDTKEW